MRITKFTLCLLLFLALLPAFWQTPIGYAQDTCPGETIYVDEAGGEDSPTCGPFDQKPCRTRSFASERIDACSTPVQIVDGATNEVLLVSNVDEPAPWGQVIGVGFGLVAGIALGYFWRKSRVAAAMSLIVLAGSLWLAFGGVAAAPVYAQGSCPGSQVYFRNIGADSVVCAGKGNPCRTQAWSRQRARQCDYEVRIFRKRLIGWKLVEIVYPQVSGAGNQPCDEGWAGLGCRLKNVYFQAQELLEPSLPVLFGFLLGVPLGVVWHRARARR